MRKHIFFISNEISKISCIKCEGEVIEFSISNVIWNKVIRRRRKEHNKEYLCVWCFLEHVISYIETSDYSNRVRIKDERARLKWKGATMKWQTGDSVGLQLKQNDDGITSVEASGKMIDEINKLVLPYGFKVCVFGGWQAFRRFAHGEQEYINNLPEIAKE